MAPVGGAPERRGLSWGWLIRAVLSLIPLALLYGAGRYLVEEAERRWPARPGDLADLAVAGGVAGVLGLGLLAAVLFGRIEARPRPPGEAPRLGQTGGWVLARVLAIVVLLVVLFALLQDAGGNPFAIDSSSLLFALGVVAFFGAAALFLFGPAPMPTPTSHGSARWAGHRDLKRAGLLASTKEPPEPGSLLLAPYSGHEHVRLPPPGAQLHALVVGPSGSGKTRGFFMPNCAAARGSFVVTDPKGELWRETSGYHERAWRYAPREPEASRGFNWIPLCRDPRLCRQLARAVLQLDADAHEEAFWKLADLRLCAALFAHAAHLKVPTPATAYRLLQQAPDALLAELAASPVESARAAAAQLAGLRDHVRAGIVLSVADKLSFLDDPAVLRFTSAEVIAPDFTQLQRRPSAVYWVLHEQDVALLQPLSALFFTLLIDQLCRSSGPVPVSLYFDEFANIGPVPDFPTTISVARGRGLSLVLGVQSLSQLDGIYGRHGAEAIQTNCATKVVLHGLPAETCEEVSRALGEWTLEVEYAQRRPYGGGGWVPLPATETSWSQHRMARRLLTADEVRRMEHDQCVIVVANQRPIFARRWRWSHGAREAPAFSLGAAKAAALPPPAKPAPTSTGSPTSAAAAPPKPTLRDLKTKLERLDDEDLELEDLPDDFGRDRRR
jgi:type IV secretion system protein VirD4